MAKLTVGVFATKDSVRGNYQTKCFARGVESCGDIAIVVGGCRNTTSIDKIEEKVKLAVDKCDVVFQTCTANKTHKKIGVGYFRHCINRECKDRGIRQLILDSGYVHNQHRKEMVKTTYNNNDEATFLEHDYTIYYSIGYDGIKRHADYCNKNSPSDRWDKLEVGLSPWITRDGPVVLMGQPLFGASSQDKNVYFWYEEFLSQLRLVCNKKVMFRQHPRFQTLGGSRKLEDRQAVGRALRRISNWEFFEGSLEDSLGIAGVVLAYSTSAAVDSVIEGVPTVCGSDICMAWDMSGSRVEHVVSPVTPDRTQWAYDMAYTQWSCGEIKEGLAWQHLRNYAKTKSSS